MSASSPEPTFPQHHTLPTPSHEPYQQRSPSRLRRIPLCTKKYEVLGQDRIPPSSLWGGIFCFPKQKKRPPNIGGSPSNHPPLVFPNKKTKTRISGVPTIPHPPSSSGGGIFCFPKQKEKETRILLLLLLHYTTTTLLLLREP
jgi:hypothetical protein